MSRSVPDIQLSITNGKEVSVDSSTYNPALVTYGWDQKSQTLTLVLSTRRQLDSVSAIKAFREQHRLKINRGPPTEDEIGLSALREVLRESRWPAFAELVQPDPTVSDIWTRIKEDVRVSRESVEKFVHDGRTKSQLLAYPSQLDGLTRSIPSTRIGVPESDTLFRLSTNKIVPLSTVLLKLIPAWESLPDVEKVRASLILTTYCDFTDALRDKLPDELLKTQRPLSEDTELVERINKVDVKLMSLRTGPKTSIDTEQGPSQPLSTGETEMNVRQQDNQVVTEKYSKPSLPAEKAGDHEKLLKEPGIAGLTVGEIPISTGVGNPASNASDSSAIPDPHPSSTPDTEVGDTVTMQQHKDPHINRFGDRKESTKVEDQASDRLDDKIAHKSVAPDTGRNTDEDKEDNAVNETDGTDQLNDRPRPSTLATEPGTTLDRETDASDGSNDRSVHGSSDRVRFSLGRVISGTDVMTQMRTAGNQLSIVKPTSIAPEVQGELEPHDDSRLEQHTEVTAPVTQADETDAANPDAITQDDG